MALQLRAGLIDRTIAETAVGAAFGSDGVVGILTGGTIQNNTFPLTAEQSAVRIHAGQCRFSISGIFGRSPGNAKSRLGHLMISDAQGGFLHV